MPRFRYDRSPYAKSIFALDGSQPTDDRAMSGWGPVRWQEYRRSGNTEVFQSVTIGVSHWLLLMLYLPLPLRRLQVLFLKIGQPHRQQRQIE